LFPQSTMIADLTTSTARIPEHAMTKVCGEPACFGALPSSSDVLPEPWYILE
jgi:hypothetical protein